MKHHIIIGNGPAGVVAAETLRKHSATEDTITLIGDEEGPPYSRMAIPYLLIGKVGEEGTHLRHGEGHYERQGISLRRGRAKRVDVQARSVELDDGSTLAFDRLLGRSDTSAWVAIYSADADEGKQAQAAVRVFAAEMGAAIDDALRKTAER